MLREVDDIVEPVPRLPVVSCICTSDLLTRAASRSSRAGFDAVSWADRLGCLERPAAGEDRRPTEDNFAELTAAINIEHILYELAVRRRSQVAARTRLSACLD